MTPIAQRAIFRKRQLEMLCYFAAIANYYRPRESAVRQYLRSAILATAWLIVNLVFSFDVFCAMRDN